MVPNATKFLIMQLGVSVFVHLGSQACVITCDPLVQFAHVIVTPCNYRVRKRKWEKTVHHLQTNVKSAGNFFMKF